MSILFPFVHHDGRDRQQPSYMARTGIVSELKLKTIFGIYDEFEILFIFNLLD